MVQFWKSIIFCPKCGVRSLLRDMDKQGHHRVGERQIPDGTEWFCTTCGFGFRISKSRKWHDAEELFRRERKNRTGKPSDNVSRKVLDDFVEFLEEGGT